MAWSEGFPLPVLIWFEDSLQVFNGVLILVGETDAICSPVVSVTRRFTAPLCHVAADS